MATFYIHTHSQLAANLSELTQDILNMVERSMPSKGDVESDCQKLVLINSIMSLDHAINGLEASDLESNQEEDFEAISYSTSHNGTHYQLFNVDTDEEAFKHVTSRKCIVDTNELESLFNDLACEQSEADFLEQSIEVPLYDPLTDELSEHTLNLFVNKI